MAKRRNIEITGFKHKNPIPAVCRIGNMLMTGIITGTDPTGPRVTSCRTISSAGNSSYATSRRCSNSYRPCNRATNSGVG